jgi:tape measure domain-containing protein
VKTVAEERERAGQLRELILSEFDAIEAAALEAARETIASLKLGIAHASHLSQATAGIASLAGGVAKAASAVLDFHVSMLAANDGLIQMRNRIRSVTDSQTAFNFALANTRSLADRTFTGLDTTVDVYSRVAGATRELGLTQQHVTRLTETLSKSFAASGKSAGENAAAMLQLSQALGSGELAGDEFKSLAENAPELLNVFARELGVTRGELKKLGSEGKITTDVMISGLDKMADAADRAFDRMEKTFAQKLRPLMNQLAADPGKLRKVASLNTLSDVGDVTDLLGAGNDAGLFRNELVDSQFEILEAGKGATAALGRAYEELGVKLRKVGDELSATSTIDPFKTPATTILSFDLQVQELIQRVEKLNSPTAAADGALMWKALGASIATFSTNAISDLDGVIGRLASLVAPGGGKARSGIAGVIDSYAAYSADTVKGLKMWSDAGAGSTGGSRARTKAADPWAEAYVSETLATIDSGIALIKSRIELFNEWKARSVGDLDTFANAGVTGLGAIAGGPTNLDIANDPNFLKPADAALAGRVDAEKNRQAYVLEQQTKKFAEYEKVATQALSHVEDAFVKLFTTGEFGAKEMFGAIMADLTRMATHRLLMSLLGAALPSAGGATFAGGAAATGGLAHGGSWTAPHHAAHGLRIGGSSTVGDKVPFFAMVNSGETVDIRNRFQQGDRSEGGAGHGRDRVIMVEDRRQLTAAQLKEDVIRIVMDAGFKRGR